MNINREVPLERCSKPFVHGSMDVRCYSYRSGDLSATTLLIDLRTAYIGSCSVGDQLGLQMFMFDQVVNGNGSLQVPED